jgi:hypothetical protein
VEPELDIQGILERLAEGEVDHIVIGGVAVGFHGYVRATKDLDVVPAPDGPNLERLATVLRVLDAELDGSEDFESSELFDPLDPTTLAKGGNWVLRTRLGRFDLMQWFDETALWEMLSPNAKKVAIGDLFVKFASYEDLVTLKQRAGRPEDLRDLERLRQARGE